MNKQAGVLALLLVSFLAACSDQSATVETKDVESADAGVSEEEVRAVSEAEAAAKLLAEAQAEKARLASEAAEQGTAYLHINSQKPNVKVMKSGLQFEILEQGEGKSPGLTSRVVTHYTGTFTNGDVFDSSVERGQPAEFPVNRVIAGWTEALQMMKEGDVWRLVIPSNLAYGERGAGDTIPPNSVLIFEVELIEVVD